MSTRTTLTMNALNELYAIFSDPRSGIDDFLLIETAGDMAAVMSMPPGPSLQRAGRWVETRSQNLGDGRTLYAVVSGDAAGALEVTAHNSVAAAAREYLRLSEDILGRRGTPIAEMNAVDLLHRTVVNQHGAAFHVAALSLDDTGSVVIELLDVDENDQPLPGTESGVLNLDGWHLV